MIKADPEFSFLLPKLRKKLFHGAVERFGVQKYFKGTKKFQFDWNNRSPIAQDFIDHFYKNGMDKGHYIEGALGFIPLQKDNIIKKVTIDADDLGLKQFCISHIIPKCKDMDIDWFLEHGGETNDRCHLTILVDGLPLDLVKQFFRQFFAELGEPILGRRDELFLKKDTRFDEVYGVNKVNQLCRFHYGFNAKPDRNKRYPCEYKGEDIDDVLTVVNALLDMQPITEEFMKSYIKEDFFPPEPEKPDLAYKSYQIKYTPLNLEIPIDYLPPELKPVYGNCQALHGMLVEALKEDLIQEAGQQHHDAGLALAGTFRYVNLQFNTERGKEAWEKLKSQCRFRSDRPHNWWYGPDKHPATYLWTCAKYDEWYGRCDGCPFAGKINSPRDLIRGVVIQRKMLDNEYRLVDIKQIREVTFPEIKSHIKNLVDEELALEGEVIAEE